jgi:mannosyltransferase OCH1-like enzyme
MIPKIIHYIWLGPNPKPSLAEICILSWREKNPDYEVIEWNENNLDLKKLCAENRFFSECLKRKMWAFMADYIRLKILYEIGGIYLDTDMLVLKPLDIFLENEAFAGVENAQNEISCGIMGFVKGSALVKSVLDFYQRKIWEKAIWTIPQVLTYVVENAVDIPGLKIYDREYFYPFPYKQSFSISCITENSYTIHWWAGSWSRKFKPYLFLSTKHIRHPAVKVGMIIKKSAGYYMRKHSLLK